MANPYTIKIFVPDGDPEGVKIIEQMNWTGLASPSPVTSGRGPNNGPSLAKLASTFLSAMHPKKMTYLPYTSGKAMACITGSKGIFRRRTSGTGV